MADISKGYDFVPGEQVTDIKLDNLSDASTILPAFVTAKTELTVPTGTEFFNVIDSTGGFKKVKLSNIPGASTQPNPVYTTLTPSGGFIDQNCVISKVYQNAKVTLNGNLTLRVNGATNGMFGVVVVVQDATGNRTLTLPANSVILGQWGLATAADISLQASATTLASWTYDGAFLYWTFAKFTVATPFCRAYMTSLSLGNAALTPVPYDNETQDNDGMHSNVTQNTRITVQRPGIYMANAYLAFANNSVGTRYGGIYYNGTVLAATRHPAAFLGEVNVSTLYAAVKGDYFEVQAFQDRSLSLMLTNSTFVVTRVGAV
jgi:hypothetical protein